MIKQLKIKNFRCFKNSLINFKELSVLVGKNNSGKSTIIEALRIISIITNRYRNLKYIKSPYWASIQTESFGVSPSINNLDISPNNIFHLYGDPPAIIEVKFENKMRIEAFIGENAEVFAIIYDQENKEVSTKRRANSIDLPIINILPQISPLLREEKIIKFETVQSNLLTKLSSRNFRNQIRYYNDDFKRFCELAERTWKGVSISNISNLSGFKGEPLHLMVRDDSFTAEIGWMGHGIQMWLQTMWFLARAKEDSTIILDEPDVYMHADLQRRLIRLVKEQFKQIIIATHSIEIMAEVEGENILPINNKKYRLSHANSSPFVQKLIDDLGSIHNIEIARIFTSKKFLIVEGDKDDIKILSTLQGKLINNIVDTFDTIPKTYVEGWGGWQRVVGANKVFSDVNLQIKVYCIFDSDYHTIEEKAERLSDAKSHSINLHIWNKKEIENYLLIPSAICETIKKYKRKGSVSIGMVESKLEDICENCKNDLYDDFATEIQSKNRGLALKTANKNARNYVDSLWDNNKYDLVPGKKVIKELSAWANEDFEASINKFKIARNIKRNEILNEVKSLIETIENNNDFTHLKGKQTESFHSKNKTTK